MSKFIKHLQEDARHKFAIGKEAINHSALITKEYLKYQVSNHDLTEDIRHSFVELNEEFRHKATDLFENIRYEINNMSIDLTGDVLF